MFNYLKIIWEKIDYIIKPYFLRKKKAKFYLVTCCCQKWYRNSPRYGSKLQDCNLLPSPVTMQM